MSYKRVTTSNGRHYLQEVESVWDPKRHRSTVRVLAHLGPCDKKGKLLRPPRLRVDGVHSSFPVGPLAALYAAARQLRVRENVEDVLPGASAPLLLCLALNQATSRVPLYRLADWVRASPLPRWEEFDATSLTVRDFEAVLSALCHLTPEKTWEDRGLLLQQELTRTWRSGSREPAGVYYDITKQAYYGTHCPYAQVGHDERGTATVIGFGMVVSREHHHPVLCQTLPGAQGDSLSVAPTLEMLEAHGLRRLMLVMDRGMTSKPNIERALDAGHHVTGVVKGWNKETIEYASRWPGDELERTEHVVGTSHDHAVYSRAFTAPLFGMSRVRLAVVENIWRKAEDRQARDLLLQELEGPVPRKRLGEIRLELGDVIVPSPGRRGFKVDPKAVERERALDGRFLLFSTDLSLDGRGMYRTYFARDAIEKAFRTSKGELSLAPIRYRRKDRLDAYATVVYLAYLLWSWAERRLRGKLPLWTLSEAMRSLEGVSWVRFGTGKSIKEWCTRLNEDQQKLLSAVKGVQYVATY
ncbi:MAG TPA: transposase [Rubrobacteraceae bacterium]|nr:transposase [Rubrobacteraceae bacterium]